MMKKSILSYAIIVIVFCAINFVPEVSAKEILPWPVPPETNPLNHQPTNDAEYESYRQQLEDVRDVLENKRMEKTIDDKTYKEEIHKYKESIEIYRNKD